MRTLEPKGEENRRLAELALLSDQPTEAGSCPQAETLAALVEGGLADRQRDQVLAHIAACPTCEVLWRQLDREWQEQTGAQTKPKRWRLLPGRRGYVAAGSLLAAAASLALFLNLTHQGSRMPLLAPAPDTPTTPLMDQAGPQKPAAPAEQKQQVARPAEAEQRGPRAEQKSRQHSEAPPASLAGGASSPNAAQRAQPSAPAPNHPMTATAENAPPPAENGAPALPAGRAKVAAEPAPAPPGAQPAAAAPVLAKKARQTEATPQPQAAGSLQAEAPRKGGLADQVADSAAEPLSHQGWLDSLSRGCRQPADQRAADFFAAAARQGRQLLPQSRNLSQADQRQMAALISALEAPLPATERCQRILRLLPPANPSPGPSSPGIRP